MVAFDTNVVVRLLVGDDPAQTKKAERALVEGVSEDGVFLSLIVLAEVAWVLNAFYEWDRGMIHASLQRLVNTNGVVVEHLELVYEALGAYGAGSADFPDYFILGKARSAGATLMTFDKKLARLEGVTLL